MDKTTIQIDSDTRDRLRAAKVGNETYDDVLDRLLSRPSADATLHVVHDPYEPILWAAYADADAAAARARDSADVSTVTLEAPEVDTDE